MIRPYNGSTPLVDTNVSTNGLIASGAQYHVVIGDDLTLEGATAVLSEVMEILSKHPNFTPLELQGVLMGALMSGGD